MTPTQAHAGLDPVIGSVPDPDPVGGSGIGPDPDPVIGNGPGPDPAGPDPDPVPVGSSPPQVHLEIFTFPLTALASTTPHPSIGAAFAVPEHFLSQVILLRAHDSFVHLQSTVHLHFFLPNIMVAFSGARFRASGL